MPLTCECYDDYEWFWSNPEEQPLAASRAKRCVSCGTLVKPGETVVRFHCYRPARSDIEERIHGGEVPLANRYLCEPCGDLFWTLDELGFCISLGENMRELAREYAEVYA